LIAASEVQHTADPHRSRGYPVNEDERGLDYRKLTGGGYAPFSAQGREVLEQGRLLLNAHKHFIRRSQIVFHDVEPGLESVLVGAWRPLKPLC